MISRLQKYTNEIKSSVYHLKYYERVQYRIIQKKLFHKSEEKMQGKMKMILQKDENLVHMQQQYSVSFVEKIDSKSGFF